MDSRPEIPKIQRTPGRKERPGAFLCWGKGVRPMGRGMGHGDGWADAPVRAGCRGDLWSPGGVPDCWRQRAPHFLFDLAEKKMGRARSKRKERHGGSGCASASLRPPAGDSWPFLAAASSNVMPLGRPLARGGPGYPMLLFPLALCLVVDGGAGYRVCQRYQVRLARQRRPVRMPMPKKKRSLSVR